MLTVDVSLYWEVGLQTQNGEDFEPFVSVLPYVALHMSSWLSLPFLLFYKPDTPMPPS